MSDQNQEFDDLLTRTPQTIVRNTIWEKQIFQGETHTYIRAGARVLSSLVDPEKSSDEMIDLIIGAKRNGFLSMQKILDEAATIDLRLADAWNFRARWKCMQDYLMDLLSYALKDEQWRYHTREAAKELVYLAEARSSGEIDLSVAEVIDRVCRLDQEMYHDSPGYILHLLLAPAARPGGSVAHAVCGMYEKVIRRWHAACRSAFSKFDITLRPDITLDDFARALVVAADGTALQSMSTSGQLNKLNESQLSNIVMMLLVGAVDMQKSGIPLAEAAEMLTKDAGAGT